MPLDTLGFHLFPSVFSPEEMDALIHESDTRLSKQKAAGERNLTAKSRLFLQAANSPKIRALLPDPRLTLVRSLWFDKTPLSNWPVAWHQDLSIAVQEKHVVAGYGPWSVKEAIPHVQPPVFLLESMVTVRIHLDDVDDANGPLRVIPGSHRAGIMKSDDLARHLKQDVASITCRRGDVLVMKPLLLHSSNRALNPTHRRIFHLEFGILDQLHPSLSWAYDSCPDLSPE